MSWQAKLATYPTTQDMVDKDDSHARLTPAGLAKMQRRVDGEVVRFVAGKDYRIKEEGGDNWGAIPADPATEHCRHMWIFERYRRSKDPCFNRCPMPKKGSREAERSAAMVMTYFRPHTLLRGLADKHVLHLADFRGGHDTWQKALTHWLNGGVLCEEAKKHINNFLAVTRARPAGDNDELDGNSDDMLSDEELFVTSGQLDEALGTAHAEESGAEEEQDVEGRSSRAAMRRGADAWPTEAGDAAQHRAGSKRIAADVLKKYSPAPRLPKLV